MFKKGIKIKLSVLLVTQFFLFSNFSWSYPSKEETIDSGNNLAIGNLTPGRAVNLGEEGSLTKKHNFKKLK